MSSQPPPTYTQLPETQVIITPLASAVQFQNGFLGAEKGSAVEGEVHVKSALLGEWQKLTVTFVTEERAGDATIQLVSRVSELWTNMGTSSSTSSTVSSVPTSSAFSIPLPEDVPHSLSTAVSSITHKLVATLSSASSTRSSIVATQIVDIRRYSDLASSTVETSPVTISSDSPTRMEMQVPRTVYRFGEIIPVYVTVPVPNAQTVVQQGLRLRSIKVELTRTITVTFPSNQSEPSSSTLQPPPSSTTTTYTSVFAKSGAAARLHSSRPVRLRLLLHVNSTPTSPIQQDGEAGGCPISQTSVFHTVSFSLQIILAFFGLDDTKLTLPVTILPPLQPSEDPLSQDLGGGSHIPVGEAQLENTYRKKFDKPPDRTVRAPDADYGVAGTSSAAVSGAPPPFEESEGPPPPFPGPSHPIIHHDPPTNDLPTFWESQRATNGAGSSVQTSPASIPLESGDFVDPDILLPSIGEGTLFGFRAEEQFDGLEPSVASSSSSQADAPPSIIDAQGDPDVTALAELVTRTEAGASVPQEALVEALVSMNNEPAPPFAEVDEGLGIVLVDDPADPPPAIDDASFTSSTDAHHHHHIENHVREHISLGEERSRNRVGVDEGGPPPYLNSMETSLPASGLHGEHEHDHPPPPPSPPPPVSAQESRSARPPPYVELEPPM